MKEFFFDYLAKKYGSDLKSEKFPELDNFDPKESYGTIFGEKNRMSIEYHNIEAGKISNLIVRMGNQGATRDEILSALKYSMVVFDSAKHDLDWKKAREELGIGELEKKYPWKKGETPNE